MLQIKNMITFQDLLNDLNSAFENFFNQVVTELSISLSEDEKKTLQVEVYQLFKTTIFEAVSEIIPNSDKVTIEYFLSLHPESNEFDTYFSLAANNPEANSVLARKFEETINQIRHFYINRLS